MTYFSLYDLREGIGLDRNDGHKDSILYSFGKDADSAIGNNKASANAYALMMYFAGPGNDPKKATFYKLLLESKDGVLAKSATGPTSVAGSWQDSDLFPV